MQHKWKGFRAILDSYVNGITDTAIGPHSRPNTDFGKPRQTGFFDIVEFRQRLFDVLAFLPKLGALFIDLLHQKHQLARFARRFLVDVNDLANFGDRETDTTTAQDFLNEAAVRSPEKPCAPATFRVNQSLVLVKPQGAGGNTEFACQFGYAIILIQGPIRFITGRYYLTFT
ncbi:hypothetical protein AGR9A_Cc120049 [Agrobacterium salinitolerans str. Hayward 0363]|nr:hypothetical protein AGR9A_Cc120049 [Agrobacterium salinitolerans str. Hayward 0363]